MLLCYKCLKNIDNNDIYHLHHSCFTTWFGCDADARFRGLTPHKNLQSDDLEIARSSFFHGRFKKYTAHLGDQHYLLKVAEPEYLHLPAVEYVCNQVADSIGLTVPLFFLIQFEGWDCFVSKDFFNRGAYWKNFTHIYHYMKPGDRLDVETLTRALFDTTKNPKDIDQFHLTVLFDALIGNHDRHGRNFGILSRGARHRLAPIYDNPSYIGIETLLGADLNPCGKIFTQASDEPTMRDYVIELKRLGAKSVLSRFARHCDPIKIKSLVESPILPPKVQVALLKLIEKRYDEFKTTLA